MEMTQNYLKFLRENPIYVDGVRVKKIEAGIDEENEILSGPISAMYSEMNKHKEVDEFESTNVRDGDELLEEFNQLIKVFDLN